MPLATYRARTRDTSPLCVALFPGLEPLVAIHNRTQNSAVQIRRIWWNETTWQSNVGTGEGVPPTWTAWRVTAVSGGQSIPLVAHDTANTLPAQVTLRMFPDTVTITDQLAVAGDNGRSQHHHGTTAIHHGSWTTGATLPIAVFRHWLREAGPVQPIVLREGDGMGIGLIRSGKPSPAWGEMIIREQASGAVYVATTHRFQPAELDRPHVVLFNASGSGVILEVMSIVTMAPHSRDGWSNWPGPALSVRRIHENTVKGAEDLLISKSDTAEPDLPINIQLLRDPQGIRWPDASEQAFQLWQALGIDTRVPASLLPWLRRIGGLSQSWWPLYGSLGRVPGTMSLWWDPHGAPLTLNPNEVIAILGGSDPQSPFATHYSWGNFDFTIEFTLDAMTPAPLDIPPTYVAGLVWMTPAPLDIPPTYVAGLV
jgi:hypothetical protein